MILLVGLKLIFLTVSSAMSLLRLSRREEWWKDAARPFGSAARGGQN